MPGLAGQYPPEGSGGEDPGFFPGPAALAAAAKGAGHRTAAPAPSGLACACAPRAGQLWRAATNPLLGCRVRLVGESGWSTTNPQVQVRFYRQGPQKGTLTPVVRNAYRGSARLHRATRWLGAGLVPTGNIQRPTPAACEPPHPCGRGLRPSWALALPPPHRQGRGHLPHKGLSAAVRSCAGRCGLG